MWLDDTPIAVLKPAGTPGGLVATSASNPTISTAVFFVWADHLDTPRAITNLAGQAVWAWDGDAFGTTAANQNPNNAGVFTYNLRFPGQYLDSESGNHYNYFRDYDPAQGRYVQSDPIGLAAE